MDKQEAIKILTEIEQLREKHQNHQNPDYIFRLCAAIVAQATGFTNRADWEPLTRGETPAPEPEGNSMTAADWNNIAAGDIIEVTAGSFEYFRDCLPPAFMCRDVTLINGSTVRAAYGFVEGADRVTAFWIQEGKYYAAGTTIFSRGN